MQCNRQSYNIELANSEGVKQDEKRFQKRKGEPLNKKQRKTK